MHGPRRLTARGWLTLAGLALLLGCSPASPPAAPAPASAAASPSTSASASASGAPAASVPAAPAAPPRVEIGVAYSSKTPNQLPLWLAAERGYFAEQGLDANVVFLSSTLSGQALLANSVQFGLMGPEGIDLNLEAGAPITRYIAGVTPKLVFKIVAQPTLRGVADLRGATVSATRKGSVTDFLWRKVLALNGLELERDVAIVYPGSTDAAFTATLVGQVAATPVTTPLDFQALQRGLQVLVDVEALNIAFLMGGVAVRSDVVLGTPDVVERYLRAHLQGVATMHNDPETAITVLGQYLGVDDRDQLRVAYETYRPTMTRDQLVPEAAIVATLQESLRPEARTANPRDFYDNAPLERIIQSGYVERLHAGR